MLEVTDIDVFYGASQALFGMSLKIGAGEFVTLMGRNGMGKTTTVHAIMGIVPLAKGAIRFGDTPLHTLPSHRIAQAGLGLVPEGRQIFPNLTVHENLIATAANRKAAAAPWTAERIYTMFPQLAERQASMGNLLSGGEQQMLAIARTLMGNPVLLLLDEPSEGLAPIIVQRIGELLRQLRGTGATVLIAEQNMHFCLGLASHATVIDKGQIVYTSSIEELKANDNIRQRYLAL